MNLKRKTIKKFSGITIIEMIIAIGIFTMGIAGFTLLFIKSWEINSFTLETGQASMAASRGVQAAVDSIRNARQADNGSFPIVSAEANDLVFYGNADDDAAVERIHYYYSQTQKTFYRGVTDPTADIPPQYPAGDQSVFTVATSVVNEVDDPVFSYYDIDNNLLSGPILVAQVKMVKINLKVNIDPNHAPDNIAIQSYATIRNLNEYD